MKTWANILLGAWLVLTGLIHLGGLSFSKSAIIIAAFGIVTGMLLFIANSSDKISIQLGSILLGAWLVTSGLLSLTNIHFSGSSVILAVLAVAAGVMILITRR
jgi:hypothetical protein